MAIDIRNLLDRLTSSAEVSVVDLLSLHTLANQTASFVGDEQLSMFLEKLPRNYNYTKQLAKRWQATCEKAYAMGRTLWQDFSANPGDELTQKNLIAYIENFNYLGIERPDEMAIILGKIRRGITMLGEDEITVLRAIMETAEIYVMNIYGACTVKRKIAQHKIIFEAITGEKTDKNNLKEIFTATPNIAWVKSKRDFKDYLVEPYLSGIHKVEPLTEGHQDIDLDTVNKKRIFERFQLLRAPQEQQALTGAEVKYQEMTLRRLREFLAEKSHLMPVEAILDRLEKSQWCHRVSIPAIVEDGEASRVKKIAHAILIAEHLIGLFANCRGKDDFIIAKTALAQAQKIFMTELGSVKLYYELCIPQLADGTPQQWLALLTSPWEHADSDAAILSPYIFAQLVCDTTCLTTNDDDEVINTDSLFIKNLHERLIMPTGPDVLLQDQTALTASKQKATDLLTYIADKLTRLYDAKITVKNTLLPVEIKTDRPLSPAQHNDFNTLRNQYIAATDILGALTCPPGQCKLFHLKHAHQVINSHAQTLASYTESYLTPMRDKLNQCISLELLNDSPEAPEGYCTERQFNALINLVLPDFANCETLKQVVANHYISRFARPEAEQDQDIIGDANPQLNIDALALLAKLDTNMQLYLEKLEIKLQRIAPDADIQINDVNIVKAVTPNRELSPRKLAHFNSLADEYRCVHDILHQGKPRACQTKAQVLQLARIAKSHESTLSRTTRGRRFVKGLLLTLTAITGIGLIGIAVAAIHSKVKRGTFKFAKSTRKLIKEEIQANTEQTAAHQQPAPPAV